MKRAVQNSAFPGVSGSALSTGMITGIVFYTAEMSTWGKRIKTEKFDCLEEHKAKEEEAASVIMETESYDNLSLKAEMDGFRWNEALTPESWPLLGCSWALAFPASRTLQLHWTNIRWTPLWVSQVSGFRF